MKKKRTNIEEIQKKMSDKKFQKAMQKKMLEHAKMIFEVRAAVDKATRELFERMQKGDM